MSDTYQPETRTLEEIHRGIDYERRRAPLVAFGAVCSRIMGRLFLLLFVLTGIGILLLLAVPSGIAGLLMAVGLGLVVSALAQIYFGPN